MLIIHKQDFLYLMVEDDRRDVTDTSIFLTVLLIMVNILSSSERVLAYDLQSLLQERIYVYPLEVRKLPGIVVHRFPCEGL
jgi:hypothetical protein